MMDRESKRAHNRAKYPEFAAIVDSLQKAYGPDAKIRVVSIRPIAEQVVQSSEDAKGNEELVAKSVVHG